MKKRNRKRLFKIIFVIIIALLLPYAAEFLDISAFKASESVEISIPMGSSVRDIAGILKEEKLIKSETIFLLKYKIGTPAELNYGNFILNKKMSISTIIEELAKPPKEMTQFFSLSLRGHLFSKWQTS